MLQEIRINVIARREHYNTARLLYAFDDPTSILFPARLQFRFRDFRLAISDERDLDGVADFLSAQPFKQRFQRIDFALVELDDAVAFLQAGSFGCRVGENSADHHARLGVGVGVVGHDAELHARASIGAARLCGLRCVG